MAVSFNDYTCVYDWLLEFLEWFNEKWPSYKFNIEPFLSSNITDIVGMFSDYGMIVFLYIDDNLIGKYQELHSTLESKRIRINPNNLISNKDFEMLLINYSINFLKKLKGN